MTRSSLGHNKAYVYTYKVVLRFLVRFILPLSIVIVINIILIVVLRKATRWRKDHTRGDVQEARITYVLMSICGVFVACHTPVFISSIFTNLYYLKLIQIKNDKVTTFANFMLTINSCVNIIVYFLVSSQFRSRLKCSVCKSMRWRVFTRNRASFTLLCMDRTDTPSVEMTIERNNVQNVSMNHI